MKLFPLHDKPQDDLDLLASRAVEPMFYRAPVPDTLPHGMVPMEFQFAGPEYLLRRDHGILGDAPGLTKTAQSIMLSNALGARHTLVICPASLRLNWEREIWAWSTLPNVSTYPILKASDGVSLEANYVIISFNLLNNPGIFAALTEYLWDHVIVDEAHALKDPRGNQRTNRICSPEGGIAQVAGRFTLASGTLMPNQPDEAYNAIRLCNWETINRASLEDFREFYYDVGEGMVRSPVWDEGKKAYVNKLHWSSEVRNVPRHLDDLQFRLRKHVMVRRLKEQVLHELPPKTWHAFPLIADSEVRKALKHPGWSRAAQLYEFDPGAFDHAGTIDGEISTARRLLGEAKAPLVVEYAKELMAEGVHKLVVSAWHHSVLDILREALESYGLVYMDGNTTSAKKQYAVDQFQQNDNVRIILGQMLPLGEGWTLTAAQDALLAEFDWVPGKNDQLLDRIHRKGQRGEIITGHVPVVPQSLEERILSRAIEKGQVIHEALDRQS